MSLFVVICVLVAAGLLLLRVLTIGQSGRRRNDVDVTDTQPKPPAHPDRPIPGSSTDRERHGKP
ncbi:MAG: hypothetical protein M3Z03_07295 [Actinomycetota bacterium]|nr:hypothetical protein [Actinomycetota bacterium]